MKILKRPPGIRISEWNGKYVASEGKWGYASRIVYFTNKRTWELDCPHDLCWDDENEMIREINIAIESRRKMK